VAQLIPTASKDNILSDEILSTSVLWPLTTKPPSNASIGQLISAEVSRILGLGMGWPSWAKIVLLSVLPTVE